MYRALIFDCYGVRILLPIFSLQIQADNTTFRPSSLVSLSGQKLLIKNNFLVAANANLLIHDCHTQDWEVGMYQNLEALWSQKTCPDPDRLFKTLGALETKIQGKDEEMIYPEVCVWIDSWSK